MQEYNRIKYQDIVTMLSPREREYLKSIVKDYWGLTVLFDRTLHLFGFTNLKEIQVSRSALDTLTDRLDSFLNDCITYEDPDCWAN